MNHIQRLLRFRTAFRYILVGVVTTFLCSSGTIILYHFKTIPDPALANVIATILVQPVAYMLHGKFTYGVNTGKPVHKRRFFIFAVVAIIVGYVCVRLAHASPVSYVWGLVTGWFLVPAANYLIMTVWVFHHPDKEKKQ